MYGFRHKLIEMLMNWVIIGSGNGLTLGKCQAIAWTIADSLLFEPLAINYMVKIESYLKMMPAKHQPFRSGLNMFTDPKLLHYVQL